MSLYSLKRYFPGREEKKCTWIGKFRNTIVKYYGGKMTQWFITENHQIIDLKTCKQFWIEKFSFPPQEFHVLCEDYQGRDLRIAVFHSQEIAENYLKKIYEIIKFEEIFE